MNKVYLTWRLFDLQMYEGESVANHINEFNMIVSQLSSVEINFEGEIKALILMSSLPELWGTVVGSFRGFDKLKLWGTVVGSFQGFDKLKFDKIQDVVLGESIRKPKIGDSLGNALSVDRRGRSKLKSPNKHERSKSKNQEKSPNKPNVKCWSCGEKCHFRTDYTR